MFVFAWLLLQPILPVLPLTFTQISVPQAFSSCFYLSRLAFNNWQNLHDKLTGKGSLLRAVGEVSLHSLSVCNSANVLKMHSFCKRGFSASWWDKGDLWATSCTRLSLVLNWISFCDGVDVSVHKKNVHIAFWSIKILPLKFSLSSGVKNEISGCAVHVLLWHVVLDVHGDCILGSMNNELHPVYCSVLHFYLSPIEPLSD